MCSASTVTCRVLIVENCERSCQVPRPSVNDRGSVRLHISRLPWIARGIIARRTQSVLLLPTGGRPVTRWSIRRHSVVPLRDAFSSPGARAANAAYDQDDALHYRAPLRPASGNQRTPEHEFAI